MQHLGDITKISGYTAPIVDCVIGGSPCQGLSVAGLGKGLDDERSGLYIEQVRVAKEMRERDRRNGRSGVDVRPRYMVWENVPGAFSSNKGEDFRIVLEEIAKVNDKDAVIPMPDTGKWANHGCILGNGWSVAWRVLDAQFWGVPQRRRRIALVADFGGHSAPEILFIRKSVSGHPEPSEPKRKEASYDASRSLGADDCLGTDLYNAVILGDTVSTLGVNCGMSHGRQCVLEPLTFEPGIASREGGHIYENVSETLRANAGDNQMATAYLLKIRSGVEVDSHGKQAGKGALIQEEKSATLGVSQDQYLFQPVVYGISPYHSNGMKSDNPHSGIYEAETARTLDSMNCGYPACNQGGMAVVQPVYSVENHPNDSRVGINEDGKVQALTSRMGTGGGNVPMVLALDRASYNQGKNAQYDFEISDKGINSPLVAKGPSAVCYWDGSQTAGTLTANNASGSQRMPDKENFNCVIQNIVRTRYIVRRLTPLECERLQGFPDGWTDIGEWVDAKGKTRQTSDAARYKALGNSIALPPWKWVLKRLCACYERDATMASLFDGIGGFPYLWEQLNGKGSCLWASEIEEFPIAVTKVRIGL